MDVGEEHRSREPAPSTEVLLTEFILAASFKHAAKVLLRRFVELSGASAGVFFQHDRLSSTFRPVEQIGVNRALPEKITFDRTEDATQFLQEELQHRHYLLGQKSIAGYNIPLCHPVGRYLLAVIRLEFDQTRAGPPPVLATFRKSADVYAAILSQAAERDRIGAERERLLNLQRHVSELEIKLDEPELEQVLGGLLDAAIARASAQKGCVLLKSELEEGLLLQPAAYRGNLLLDPASLPRLLRPRSAQPVSKAAQERRHKPRADGVFFRVLRNQRPYVTDNLETDSQYCPLFAGSRSCLAVPVSSAFGDVLGVLMLESDELGAFTENDVPAVKELADVASTYILKARIHNSQLTTAHPVELIGIDRKTMDDAFMAARRKETVLLVGEAGTGTEPLARAIHRSSDRASHPFEAIKCGTLVGPPGLARLFGQAKGTFADATQDRFGLLDKVDGGTLFLDEIEKLPRETQFFVFQALKSQEYAPVGEPMRKKHINVRFIAATSVNLKKRIEEGTFLPDLYYQVSGLTLELLPLREHKRFIPKLLDRVLKKLAEIYRKSAPAVAPRALRVLRDYGYPGNVSELQNIMSEAFAHDTDGRIDFDDLPESVLQSARLNDTTAHRAVRLDEGSGKAGK